MTDTTLTNSRAVNVAIPAPRIGIHTILWGRAPESLEVILKYISDCGFEGVEIFQHPSYLREQFPDPRELRDLLRSVNLKFIGLCSGTLEDRIAFCEDADLRPEFLYVDHFDPYIPGALARDFPIAFHPHAYKQASIEEVFQRVADDPHLLFLLDPAHLYVMNQSPTAWLQRILTLVHGDAGTSDRPITSKLAGVHLKDWGLWYGRSFQRYAQGFCNLGEGSVPLDEFVRELTRIQYAGWIIAEQDHMTDTADRCVQIAVVWLTKRLQRTSLKSVLSCSSQVQSALPEKNDMSKEGERLLNALLRSHETPGAFWDLVVDQCHEWLSSTSPVVSLWEHSPSMNRLSVLSTYPRGIRVQQTAVGESLAGVVVESKSPQFIPDIHGVPGRPFSDQRIAFEYGLRSTYSVPIWNSHNPNDVQAVLNFYFTSNKLEECFPKSDLSKADPGVTLEQQAARAMTTIADYLALSIERIMADRVTKAVAQIRWIGGQSLGKEEFLSQCLTIAQQATGAAGATFFLEKGHRLYPAASTGLLWRLKTRKYYYNRGDGQVGKTWDQDVEYLVVDRGQRYQPLSEEVVDESSHFCIAYVPIRDKDKCIGVLRCRNKRARADTNRAFFTQSDVTVLQAICDAIVPRLHLFDSEERNLILFRKMNHELKTPLTGINAYLDFIEDEAQDVAFTEPYFSEARDSTALMARLITNTEIFIRQLDAEFVPEQFQKTYLLSEVVAPVRDQMAAYLRKKVLSTKVISVGAENTWWVIPKLLLRPGAIQQVFFNLFTNAIKYGWKSEWRRSSTFSIVVIPSVEDGDYVIRVRDWGIGIDDADAPDLFELGVRGKRAAEYDPYGHGFGLAIARDIMREHGGDLKLTSFRNPTEFVLIFPKRLELQVPQ